MGTTKESLQKLAFGNLDDEFFENSGLKTPSFPRRVDNEKAKAIDMVKAV